MIGTRALAAVLLLLLLGACEGTATVDERANLVQVGAWISLEPDVAYVADDSGDVTVKVSDVDGTMLTLRWAVRDSETRVHALEWVESCLEHIKTGEWFHPGDYYDESDFMRKQVERCRGGAKLVSSVTMQQPANRYLVAFAVSVNQPSNGLGTVPLRGHAAIGGLGEHLMVVKADTDLGAVLADAQRCRSEAVRDGVVVYFNYESSSNYTTGMGSSGASVAQFGKRFAQCLSASGYVVSAAPKRPVF